MISSGDVSGIFAAQNQGLVSQLDYANRIGIPGAGIGTFGAPPAGGGPGFSFGPGGFTGPGFGSGNRFAGGVISGAGLLGGAASFGSTYLGLAGMLPSSIARLLPFGGFAAGAGGMVASGGLSLLAAGISSGVHGAQQGLAFGNNLGGYNFFNPATRGGMGFGRSEAAGLADMTRSMSFLPSMLTSMEELTTILGKLKSTGVMQGAHNATEFAHRFKEAISTIRETARILGSSMEDAETFFAHSRSVGFLGRSDQLRNALNVQLTSGLTGMSNGQVMGLQSSGANLATQLGGRRSLGARAITTIAQNIGAAQRNGLLSDEMVQDLTGLSGPDGVAAASERMTGLMSRMALGTSAGQFMLAGMTKFTNGHAGLDQSLARQFNSGLISFSDLQRRGMSLTDAQKISFRARQGDLATAFAGSVGPGGMSRFLGGLVGGRGEDAENLLIQMNGGNSNDADFMHRMRGAGADMEFSQMSKFRGSEADIRERTSPSAIFKRVMTKIHAGAFGPIERVGDELRTNISKSYDEFIDDVVGRHIVSLSRGGAQALAQAMSGGNRGQMDALFSAASGAGEGSRSFTSRFSEVVFGRGERGRMERFLGGGDAKTLASATGGGHLSGLIDQLKAGNRNFQFLSAAEQVDLLRDNLTSMMVAGGASASMSDSQLSSVARGGGQAGVVAARIASAIKNAKGPAADGLLNVIASAEKFTTGPRVNLSELYDSEAVRMSRETEKLESIQRDAFGKLRSAGLSHGAISAMKDSAAVRKALGRVASGDINFMQTLWGDEAEAMKKLGLSPAELSAVREHAGEVISARNSGKDVSGAMSAFDTAQAAGDISVIAKAHFNAGAEAVAGAESIKDVAGLKGYSSVLANVGAAMLNFDKERTKETFTASQTAVRDFVTRVYADKNLSPEQRAQLMRASGTIGGAIYSVEGLRGIKGKKFTKEALADKLGINSTEGISMLENLGFTSSGATLVDPDKFDQLLSGAAGLSAASNLARTGQSNMSGQSRDDRLISTLQRIDANQSVIATVIARMAGYSDADAQKRVAELTKSYMEQEHNR